MAHSRTMPSMGLRDFFSDRFHGRKDFASRAVSVPLVDEKPPQVKAPFDFGAEPPFTLGDIRAAIPNHCFKKQTWRSLSYLARDVVAVAGLAAGALAINNPLVWPAYWFAQGTMFWALFVIGHDCGHGSFSKNKLLNNIVGHLTHSFIMVPYHGWRISHRTHHSNHGHVENDESWTPMTPSLIKDMDIGARQGRFNALVMLIVYPFYLFLRSPGKTGSHFSPSSPLFVPSERKQVLTSTACYTAMALLLAATGFKFGFWFLAKMYIIPYWLNVMWLDVVTFLHHTDNEVPWYRGSAWNYMRGALSTRDQDYGIFNNIHHDIGTHVVHHLFPQMPHYHIVEATEAVKPVLGEYFKEPEKSGPIPFHLIKKFFKGARECIYVEDEGEVIYYKSDKSILKR
ncbi:unnamed protein product [Discosporangium mesarthrocarpum]